MTDNAYNVLFLCTKNSTRSIIAEVLLNSLGQGAFKAYSAGSQPTGEVNSHAIAILKNHGHDTKGVRSKTWEEFGGEGAIKMDFIFTLSDTAANETSPVWPHQPISDHWGMRDPSTVEGSESQKRAAFANTYSLLHHHISKFLELTKSELDQQSLRSQTAKLSEEIRAENKRVDPAIT